MTGINGLGADQKSRLLDGLILCGQFFWEPNLDLAAQILDGSLAAELIALGRMLPAEAGEDCHTLGGFGQGITRAGELAALLSAAHTRLFVAARDNLGAPPYQSVYESKEGLLMGPAALEMERRLAQLNLARGERLTEPADHLSIELEYLVRLLEKGWTEDQPELIRQAVAFAKEVMVPWVTQFNARLGRETDCLFYPAAGRLTAALLNLIAAG